MGDTALAKSFCHLKERLENWKSKPGCSLESCIAPPWFKQGQGQRWHFEPPKWLFEVNMASEEQNSSLTAKLGTGFMEITSQNNRITPTIRGGSKELERSQMQHKFSEELVKPY